MFRRDVFFVYFRQLVFFTLTCVFILFTGNLEAQINFSQSTLNFGGLTNVSGATSLEFGPDGRLYIADYPGNATAVGVIRALTIQRNAPTSYVVTEVENLTGISTIPNYNDNGTPAFSVNGKRQVTGLTVVGTAANPVVYVTSSDVRIGGGTGTGEKDSGLDTNSGVITRMTWTGIAWETVDIVRGLPRSEENHAINGLEFATINGTDYLIVATGGFTNAGAPSSNFALITEYALSAAVLSINLTQINQLPILTDNGRSYIYDLPTLDDPTRPNANGIDDPDTLGYDGVDLGDPWGGNDGLNQSKLVPGGPVQIFSSGYRNTYDLVLTENGALYVTDNGANGGWGGFPENEGLATVNNDYNPAEPGSTSASSGEQVNNKDHLELVTANIQNYIFGSFYAGHPNPIRANPLGAGLYTDNKGFLGITGSPIFRTQLYDPDGSTLGSTTDPNMGLPADWPPVPVSLANPVEGDWRGPGINNPDGPNDNPIVLWNTNTNGITEYTASNFNNAMKGNLLATHSGGNLHRVQLNANGTSQQLTQNFLSGIGGFTLGITANGDDQVFPGTIWAGTINGIIVVFEPQDVVVCIPPGNPNYDLLADYDLDGYLNQDEEENGTDPCNGGSQPNDFNKILGAPLLSDLNDPDDDGDGIPDALDPMQLGNPLAVGSQAFSLPIYNDFFNDQQGLGGIFGLGLTGLMNNGDNGANWLNWLDDRGQGPNPDDVLGGAPGLMTSHMTSGTALGSSNTQDKGYQYGVRVGTSTGSFTVTGAMTGFTGELRLYGNTAAMGGELGFQIGDGTQSNYIKFVITTAGFMALQEINDVPQSPITFNLPEGERPTNGILFHFVVDPSDGQVLLEYQIDGDNKETLGSIAAQGSILNAIQQMESDLMVGLIGTSNTPGVELEGTWDFLNVLRENAFAVRINAGGPQILNNGVMFSADQNFVGGATYANNSAQVPNLYKTERSSPSQIFSYDIPLVNGDYTVILHFAEIFWGAIGGAGGGAGKRIFDVGIEGTLVLDNYDINADVGAQTVVTKSFHVTVSDGQLDIDFSALASVGGVNQPKVSAIEVLGSTPQGVPIIVNAIADQTSTIGDQLDGSLSVMALGGDGNLTYSALNLPPGLFIEPTNGQIGGTVSESTSVNTPYTVTITVDDSDEYLNDAKSIQFEWIILPENALLWIDKDENENYTARHECSFVQAGDKFYLMGGRENSQTIDIYDYTTNTWSSLINSAPLEFNHFQATEYEGLIWIIGAFKTNNFPSELPAEHIWIFNPASNEWIQGPLIPSIRQRGSAGLSVYNGKFYISGGNTIGHDGGYVPWFDEYDPATGIWTPLIDAPRARDHFHSAVIGDKLYLAGGRLSGGIGGTFKPVIPQVDVYDFSTSTWSTLSANLPTPRAAVSVVEFENKLLVIGGEVENENVYGVVTNDALKIAEEYNPVSGTWSRVADLNYKRHGTQAIVSGNGVHILAGSHKKGGGNQKNMEYLGTDTPTGVAGVGSIISVPSSVQFSGNVPHEIPITISGGNIGIFITSIELEGPDMDKFNILSGNLTNALLKANTEHTIAVEYIGLNTGNTANLVINHGVAEQEVIVLEVLNNEIVIAQIPDQNNTTGDVLDGNLTVIASGGDGALNYAMAGAPAGVSIDLVTGVISGTIATDANLSSPYNVTITVDDNDVGTDARTISFNWTVTSNTFPLIAITSPIENATFTTPANINIAANASDTDGTVVKVEFFQGTTKLGEDLDGDNGWNYAWNNVPTSTYSLTAVATDDKGATTTSDEVNIIVSNLPSPVITSFSPTSGPVGTLVTINGNNLANATSVTFGPSIAQIISNTDTMIEALVPFVNGRLPSRVKITVTTSGGNNTSNDRFTITTGTVPVNVSPAVVIDSPANNTTFLSPANIGITASASDPDGTVVKVEFFNGASKLGEDLTSPFAFTWNNVATGNYSLTAKATDDKGAVTTSAAVNVAVSLTGNTAPVVAVTSPANNSNFTAPGNIEITASASDLDGTVMKVEFFNGGSKLGEDLTSPYTYTWNNVASGNYILTANAVDNNGAISTSSSVNVTVSSSSILAPPSNLLSQWVSSNQVNLSWQDNSLDEDGFVLERATKPNFTGSVAIINLTANTISYQDINQNNKRTLYYRIKAFRGSSSSAYSNVASPSASSMANKEALPDSYQNLLLKNSFVVIPNPSSGKSTIQFKLEDSSTYSISLCNSLGAFINLVKHGQADAGVQYTQEFDGSQLAEGLYLLKLESSSGIKTFRLLLKR